jgi:hypothetical protein
MIFRSKIINGQKRTNSVLNPERITYCVDWNEFEFIDYIPNRIFLLAGYGIGREMLNVVPTLRRLSAQTFPLCVSMILRIMTSPRPVLDSPEVVLH